MVAETTSLNALEIKSATVPGRIEDVSLRLSRGVVVGLIGSNGSGKSTLLHVAAGLVPATGAVRWGNRPVTAIPAIERGRCAAWVPQEARFEFGFSVRSVAAQGRYAHGDDDRGVDAALAALDLTSLAARPVNQISGGERHRVLLARALATAAPLQLWDEPLAALDARHALDVLRLAHCLAQTGSTVLLSLHDLRVAHCLDAVAVMQAGRLCAFGPPLEVLTPELLHEVFGVRVRTGPGLILELP
jgi:iron complex transport system ATP-binding protein